MLSRHNGRYPIPLGGILALTFSTMLLLSKPAYSQFTCTFSGAKDAEGCWSVTDGGSDERCVWCEVGGGVPARATLLDFGFCVAEAQAEAMESAIPTIHCDRYSSKDDDNSDPSSDDDATPQSDDQAITDDQAASDDQSPPATDDQAQTDDQAPPETDDQAPPATDDQAPPTTDDKVDPDPSDDAIPDNYWKCLWKKDAASCSAANCTWCNTKGGFSLCLSGPSAESASHSDWFTCAGQNTTYNSATLNSFHSPLKLAVNDVAQPQAPDAVRDPLDSSCLLAFLSNPTQEGCVTAQDQSGQPCEWCSLAGITNACLTAEQAEMSAQVGVTCDASSEKESLLSVVSTRTKISSRQVVDDPYDPSCALAYLQDNSKDACLAAVDADGKGCEYCSIQGIFNLCLNVDQAAMGDEIGIDCSNGSNDSRLFLDSSIETAARRSHEKDSRMDAQDPYDPSCMLAFLQDQSPDACTSAVDADGNACEFCTVQGAFSLCLNTDQAQMGQAFGVSCTSSSPKTLVGAEYLKGEKSSTALLDPYDPSCLLAFLEDPSADACGAAVDANGVACEYCSLQGVVSFCLTAEQAELGQAVGMDCQPKQQQILLPNDVSDPYDVSCVLAYITNPSQDGCASGVDADGNACEFCTIQDLFDLCLTEEQAEMGEQFGITCNARSSMKATVQDPFDPTCALAFLQDNTKETCLATVDSEGNPCEFCSLQDSFSLCLNAEQAEAGSQIGMDCSTKSSVSLTSDVNLPSDFFACLENSLDDDDCRSSSCTWCNTEVGLGLCLSTAVADSTKECKFFDCEFGKTSKVGFGKQKPTDIYDPVCLTAGMRDEGNGDDDQHATTCVNTNGTDGKPCVWCDAAGVFGLCLSSEQANAAGEFLQCNNEYNPIVATE